MKNQPVITALVAIFILAISIAYAGKQIHGGLINFRSFDRGVVMKGLAEKDVVADLALWSISYTETGNNLSDLQNLMDNHGKKIIGFLGKHDIKQDEVSLQQVQVQDLMAQSYRQHNAMTNRYILTQSYLVRTHDVDAVSKAAKKIGGLIREGVVFSQNSAMAPTYLYTKLNEVKPEMIAQATRNARESAQQFAENSQSKVGGIKRASQGVFQILSRDKSYTISEPQQKNKTVRVVSTIEFYLED